MQLRSRLRKIGSLKFALLNLKKKLNELRTKQKRRKKIRKSANLSISTMSTMSFLIRCGRCFNQPGPVKDGVAPGMHVTECKHLLCTTCVQDNMIGGGVISRCLVCQKDKPHTMALDGSVRLPRKVALLLYGDPATILSQLVNWSKNCAALC